MPKSVFVSYNHQDGDWVWNRLVPVLKAGGADVLIDVERFKAGDALLRQMDAVQDSADVHVLVLSEDYLASDYCVHEMERAIALDPGFEHHIVIPVTRRSCTLPDAIRGPNPLYVNLKDDSDGTQWNLLLQACDADLGVTANDWLAVRDEILGFLRRDQSVNLVVRNHNGVAWRPLLAAVEENVPGLVGIDLDDGKTVPVRGFVAEILRVSGTTRDVPTDSAEALAVLSESLQARTMTRLVVRHFDRALKRYDSDLFTTLRYLVMEKRKLVLLLQSYQPFDELAPRDHEMSPIDLKTVELRGRP